MLQRLKHLGAEALVVRRPTINQSFKLSHLGFHQFFAAAAFHVQAQQRLGVRAPQAEAPVGELDADAVGAVHTRVQLGVERQDLLDRALDVGDLVVDLAAARERCDALVDQLGQGFAGDAHQFGDQQPRDVAAVAVGEIAEVVVGAHLAAIDGVFGAHALLDEGVAGLALDRNAARSFDLLNGVPSQAWVVDDLAAWVLFQEHFGQQADQVVTLDEATLVVEEEAAVEVAVPGDTHVGAVFQQGLAGQLAVFRQQRVGHAIGEVAVWLAVDDDQLQWQLGLEQFDGRADGAVAWVSQDLERLERLDVDVGQQVFDVGALVKHFANVANGGGLVFEVAGFNACTNGFQAGVAADRLGMLAHQLHAVVTLGVMAGGDHDAAVGFQVAGGEVDFFGAAQAQVEHIGAGFGQALDQGSGQAWAFQAHVAPDDIGLAVQFGDQRTTDTVGDVVIEIGRDLATNVVGLEATGLERGIHGNRSLYVADAQSVRTPVDWTVACGRPTRFGPCVWL